jgi:hypothetical protein
MARTKKVRAELKRIHHLKNIVITNRGWFRYLQTVDRLASDVAYPEPGKFKGNLKRLQQFLSNASIVHDPLVHEDMTDEQLDSIYSQYQLEIGSVK